MNDIFLIIGGVVLIAGFLVGWGTIYRFALKKGKKSGDTPVVEQSAPAESGPPYRG